jgi:hypothetical protein
MPYLILGNCKPYENTSCISLEYLWWYIVLYRYEDVETLNRGVLERLITEATEAGYKEQNEN